MLRLGIIGTGWIADQFVEAAHATKTKMAIINYSCLFKKDEES